MLASLDQDTAKASTYTDALLKKTAADMQGEFDAIAKRMAAIVKQRADDVVTMNAAVADLWKARQYDVNRLNGGLTANLDKEIKPSVAKLEVQIASNNKMFTALAQLQEHKYLVDGKDVSKMALKDITAACTAYG